MRRLSIVGLETTHGFIYPAMFNGYDPVRLTANSIPIVSGIFPTGGAAAVEGCRVVACYDLDPARARAVAEACLIDRVCSEPAGALEGVDGILICNGDPHAHRALATPALEAGLPTFLDKPFTASVEDAEALAALSARGGAPLFCTSALRYAPQLIALRHRMPRTVGEPVTAHAIGTGDYETYAVHTLEMLLAVWGSGIAELTSLGGPDHDTVQMTDRRGRRVLWQVCRAVGWFFHLAVFGSAGMDELYIPQSDRYVLFRAAAEQISRFMQTGESPVPLADTIEIVRLLAAASAHRGQPRPVLVG